MKLSCVHNKEKLTDHTLRSLICLAKGQANFPIRRKGKKSRQDYNMFFHNKIAPIQGGKSVLCTENRRKKLRYKLKTTYYIAVFSTIDDYICLSGNNNRSYFTFDKVHSHIMRNKHAFSLLKNNISVTQLTFLPNFTIHIWEHIQIYYEILSSELQSHTLQLSISTMTSLIVTRISSLRTLSMIKPSG